MVYTEAEVGMALKDVKVGRGKETILVDPTKLVIIPGWNEKEYTVEQIEEMAASLESQGQREDIRVISYKKDKVFQTKYGEYTLSAGEVAVVHGHRRTLGGRLLRERGVEIALSAKVESESLSEANLVLTQIVDNATVNLSPLQEGLLLKRSLILGNTEESVAKELGKSIQFVKDRIALAELPGTVKDLIQSNQISATNASRIFKESNNELEAVKLIEVVADREADVFISAEAAIQSLKENNGDTSVTLDKLQKAVEIVKEQGLSRVGRKHIDLVDRTPASENENDSNDNDGEVSDSAKEVVEAATAKLQKLKKPSYRAIGEELIINSAARVLPEGVLIDEEAWNEFKSHFADLG